MDHSVLAVSAAASAVVVTCQPLFSSAVKCRTGKRLLPLLAVAGTLAAALVGCFDTPDRAALPLPMESATSAVSPPAPSTSPSARLSPTPTTSPPRPPSSDGRLEQVEKIRGEISPKSVVASGTGLFIAQNMMYRHTMTVYDRDYQLVATIPDGVRLADYGHDEFEGSYRGAPVEAVFTSDGRFAYVSNYSMYGGGFTQGSDSCTSDSGISDSFAYRIDMESFAIDRVIAVGAVPKFVAISPDDERLIVSNWCSGSVSIIDTGTATELKRLPVGLHPRGLVVTPDSHTAYVAVMGGTSLARIDLASYETDSIDNVGDGPRHLSLDPGGRYVYATLNRDGRVVKVDLESGDVVDRVDIGSQPRSMAIADDGRSLYIVNYVSDTVAKVRTRDIEVLQTVNVDDKPIGITYDAPTRRVWVSAYSGSLTIFQDGTST